MHQKEGVEKPRGGGVCRPEEEGAVGAGEAGTVHGGERDGCKKGKGGERGHTVMSGFAELEERGRLRPKSGGSGGGGGN